MKYQWKNWLVAALCIGLACTSISWWVERNALLEENQMLKATFDRVVLDQQAINLEKLGVNFQEINEEIKNEGKMDNAGLLDTLTKIDSIVSRLIARPDKDLVATYMLTASKLDSLGFKLDNPELRSQLGLDSISTALMIHENAPPQVLRYQIQKWEYRQLDAYALRFGGTHCGGSIYPHIIINPKNDSWEIEEGEIFEMQPFLTLPVTSQLVSATHGVKVSSKYSDRIKTFYFRTSELLKPGENETKVPITTTLAYDVPNRGSSKTFRTDTFTVKRKP